MKYGQARTANERDFMWSLRTGWNDMSLRRGLTSAEGPADYKQWVSSPSRRSGFPRQTRSAGLLVRGVAPQDCSTRRGDTSEEDSRLYIGKASSSLGGKEVWLLWVRGLGGWSVGGEPVPPRSAAYIYSRSLRLSS